MQTVHIVHFFVYYLVIQYSQQNNTQILKTLERPVAMYGVKSWTPSKDISNGWRLLK
jgi:hypothetical protein